MNIEVTEGLKKAIQAPLITRWWSIACLSAWFTDNHLIASKACNLCVHTEASATKVYVIASNFLRMYKSSWILSDIHFLTGIASSWMNHHMRWFQDEDPNIGCHGYLSFHRVTQYYLQLRDVNEMETTWDESPKFKSYAECIHGMTDNMTAKKRRQRLFYCQIMREQIAKHNKRCLSGIAILIALFGESELAIVLAKFIRGIEPANTDLEPFQSFIHETTIDRKEYYSFLQSNVSKVHLHGLGRHKKHLEQNHIIDSIPPGKRAGLQTQ